MFVYFHRSPVTYEIFYVGIGAKETRAHTSDGRNRFWYNYVAKYGSPVVQIVHENISVEDACKWEIHYINLFGRRNFGGTLVNISAGGESGTDDPVSIELIRQGMKRYNQANPHAGKLRKEKFNEYLNSPAFQEKSVKALTDWLKNNPDKNPMYRPEIVEKFKGENNSSKRPEVREKLRQANLGKKHTEETKAILSEQRKGKAITWLVGHKHSPEVIERMKIINKEIMNRPEVKEKIRLAKIGQISKKRIPVSMIDINTGAVLKTFPYITEAYIYLGKSPRCGEISKACKGKKAKAYGYAWKYAS